MSILHPPRLDDRSFEDLRRELIRRIPVHSELWTDHNPADPGITLLELFAWLTQDTLYRLNRVPDRALTQFLSLLGVQVRAASAARALVRFHIKDTDTTPRILDFAPSVPKTLVAAGKVEFQVEDELQILPVEGYAVIKAGDPDPSKITGEEAMHDLLVHRGLVDASVTAGEALEPYVTYRLPAPDNGTVPRATSLASAVDTSLWIALLAPGQLVGSSAPSALADDLASVLAGKVLSVGVRLDDELCSTEDEAGLGVHQWDHHTCPEPGSSGRREPLRWQLATGRFTGASDGAAPADRDPSDVRYVELGVESDETLGMTRSGVVRLRMPLQAEDVGGWRAEDLPDEELLGIGDLPPLLSDAEVQDRVVTWVRCFREAGRGQSEDDLVHPALRWVDVNVVSARQAVTAGNEVIGRGRGTSEQSMELAHAPVLPASLVLEVREPSGWVRWTRVDDFAASLPDDPHFVLDASDGTIAFGDGKNGRLVRLGELVRARTYQYGGGAVGNVGGGAIARILRAPSGVRGIECTNDLAAESGRDSETLTEAKVRIPSFLRHRERAVAAQDFVDVARETPNVHVGRAWVLPRHKPHERVENVPGVVTLVVIPSYDALHPDEPIPDRAFLRAVCEHLDPRRLVTTELYVTAPEYVRVAFSVAIEVEEGYGLGTVSRWVELALRQHFAPLPPYGPKGAGWPNGRDVSAADVTAATLKVEGVRLVEDTKLTGYQIDRRGAVERVTSNVVLEGWQIPSVRGVTVVDAEVAPEAELLDGDPTRPPGGVHVPVEEDIC